MWIAQLYDAFSILPILFLEGPCNKGEGGPFVMNRRIAPGGRLPVNTSGGGLSLVHPGMFGMPAIVEACVQLRGQGGARQVKSPQIALAHGNGGYFSYQATNILEPLILYEGYWPNKGVEEGMEVCRTQAARNGGAQRI